MPPLAPGYQQPPQPQQPYTPQPAPQASQGQAHYDALHPAFRHNTYLIRRKFFAIFGAQLHVYSATEELLLYVKMKAFKLKEDITIFTDESMKQPLIRIRARGIIDFGTAYDVYDVSTGMEHKIGVLKRKGLKSMIRDEWEIWNVQDQPIGLIQEESALLAVVRRFVEIARPFLPQQYNFSINGHPMGFMKQTFNPFIMKMTADFSQDTNGYLDRRLASAAATLLCVIEGKQK